MVSSPRELRAKSGSENKQKQLRGDDESPLQQVPCAQEDTFCYRQFYRFDSNNKNMSQRMSRCPLNESVSSCKMYLLGTFFMEGKNTTNKM